MDTTKVPVVDLRRKKLLKPTNIAIQSNSSREVTLKLTGPKIEAVTGSHGCGQHRMSGKILLEYQITATNTTNGTETITHKYSFNESRVNFSYPLTSGNEYSFEVSVCEACTGKSFGTSSVFHRAVLVPWELNKLLFRAKSFVQNEHPTLISVLYRNKPSPYFRDIMDNKHGIMEVYNKDHSGDAASPINGRLQGLFFSTHAHPKSGALPKFSPFGNRRLILPINTLVTGLNKLYFADFYCHKKKHYVTLVVTIGGSRADQFCSRSLVELPVTPHGNENPFFFRKGGTNEYYCSHKLTVEVLYTENIDIAEEVWVNPNCFSNVIPVGKRRSIPDSRPKNPYCKLCNLYDPC